MTRSWDLASVSFLFIIYGTALKGNQMARERKKAGLGNR